MWRSMYVLLSYLTHFLLEWEMFQTKLYRKSEHTICSQWLAFENRAVFEITGKKLSRPAGHRWHYDACALHAGRLRLQTHTPNTLLLFHCNNGCQNTPQYYFIRSGFGGLEVACWPLVPKFVGSHPAKAVGILGRKNPQHDFLLRESKAVGPMS